MDFSYEFESPEGYPLSPLSAFSKICRLEASAKLGAIAISPLNESATSRFFNQPELLENALNYLPPGELARIRVVSKQFYLLISDSRKLQRAMYVLPDGIVNNHVLPLSSPFAVIAEMATNSRLRIWKIERKDRRIVALSPDDMKDQRPMTSLERHYYLPPRMGESDTFRALRTLATIPVTLNPALFWGNAIYPPSILDQHCDACTLFSRLINIDGTAELYRHFFYSPYLHAQSSCWSMLITQPAVTCVRISCGGDEETGVSNANGVTFGDVRDALADLGVDVCDGTLQNFTGPWIGILARHIVLPTPREVRLVENERTGLCCTTRKGAWED